MFRKKSFKQWVSDNLPLILAFAIPCIVMMLVFLQRGIYPFGDRSFLRTDLYHQYAPFFKELKEKLSSGESLLYSWSIGDGTNFVALFAYYLSSPLNWFLVLCPVGNIIEFITYMIVFKICLCGLSFAYYLKKHTNTNHIGIAFFASFYALSGYMAAYSWNIMWLDCLVLFPLVILGLERLVYEDKCILYCVSLTLCVLSNYYISIMVCLTLICYFLALLVIAPTRREEIERKDDHTLIKRTIYMNYPKKILLFAFYSFLAAGMSLILLLPEMYALQLTASADSTFPKTFSSYFTMLEMLARHLVNVQVHIGLEHWPNIYCGVGILIFVPLYIMNRKVNFREKAAYFVLILFFLASFSMNFLNFIWHGFHYPNSLPCRQSFAYNFLLLVIGYKGFMGLKDRSLKQIVQAIWIALGMVLIFEQVTKDNSLFHFSVFYVSALFIGAEGLLAYLYRKQDGYRRALSVIAVIVLILEGFSNTTVTSVTTVSRSGYLQYDSDLKTLSDYAAQKANQEATDEFGSLSPAYSGMTFTNLYRLERMALRTKNDGAWFQYPSISVFSSVANAKVTAFFKKLGMEGATNSYCSNGATALVNMLFNIRFETYDREFPTNDVTTLVASSGNFHLYQYNNTLSIGYMLPQTLEDDWGLGGTCVNNQNNFITRVMKVQEELLQVIPLESSTDKSVSFVAPQSGYYHFYVTNGSIDSVTVKVNNTSRKHTALKRRYIVDCGYVQEGQTVSVTTDETGSLTGEAYYLNPVALEKTVEILKDGCLAVTEYDSKSIKGMITVSPERTLMFTTIPYEKGWTAKVDGVPVDTEIVLDTFVGLTLTPGTHSIELSYMPDGFSLGAFASLLSLLILLLITLARFLIKRRFGYRFNVFVEEETIDLATGKETATMSVPEEPLREEALPEKPLPQEPLPEKSSENTEEATPISSDSNDDAKQETPSPEEAASNDIQPVNNADKSGARAAKPNKKRNKEKRRN